MALGLRSAIGSDVGRRRTANEDSGAAGDRLLVVADGMGGHAHGELASALTVAAMIDMDERLPADASGLDLLAELTAAVDDASARLAQHAQTDPDTQGMGTTVVALLLDGDRLALAHVGDSRIYLCRDGALTQITRDHTMVQQLVDEGQITPEEALVHPRRSVLMRALSTDHPVEADLEFLDPRPGDRFLLCSDGVTAVLPDQAVLDVLAAPTPPEVAVDQLITLSNDGGGPDNITAIVADVVEVSEAAPQPLRLVGAAAEVRS
ncbi:PP2C family serine/threonine-protein phosphatase [Pseudonocardia sp. WMMC193]|uniref:PP2C family protein-serine/threonine phosphatase n=1 Tax=Pseudonocardia sp. WMMC193 TaxID=2911965 RepID=UPI001F2DE607|nr:PP2C family serine/threonine-protein phosphatase [Pseudonocardia sp. WMMC193]MCF7550229.1 protein phosphatase 2C domain-containing protein [Pseudonocardia sp. WMMC193]